MPISAHILKELKTLAANPKGLIYSTVNPALLLHDPDTIQFFSLHYKQPTIYHNISFPFLSYCPIRCFLRVFMTILHTTISQTLGHNAPPSHNRVTTCLMATVKFLMIFFFTYRGTHKDSGMSVRIHVLSENVAASVKLFHNFFCDCQEHFIAKCS
jgi:hypothetical protein